MTTTLDIQRRLLALGYKLPKFGADGLPGNETAAALSAFQRDAGLPQAGRADAATLAKLFPPAAEFDRKAFFSIIRSSILGGSMRQDQVSGTEAIVDAFLAAGLTDRRWLAYMLATAYHETAFTMQPIEEYGKGKGRKYGVPQGPHQKVYYGRGYVQLTWDFNYQKAERELGAPFYSRPELALDPKHAADIMIRGMREGWFTGKKLSDYLGTDYLNARRIINGTDRAETIAGYARKFEAALLAADFHR